MMQGEGDLPFFIYANEDCYISRKKTSMAEPIWRDKLYNLPGDSARFRIKTSNEVIYEGVSVKRPGASSNQVRINDICADYIAHSLPLAATIPTLPVSFDVEVQMMGNWQFVATIQFLNDWSYEDGFNPATASLSHPIIPKVAPGQILPFTRTSSTAVKLTLYWSGTSQQVNMAVPTDNLVLTDSFIRALATTGWGGVAVDLSKYGFTSIKLPNNKTAEVDDCIRFVLYYINAYGGMDWFPILGNHHEMDNVERNVFDMDVNNTYRTRSRRDLQNTITKAYTLHTGWLTDDQSAMMHHLLNSTEVYLHDLWTNKVDPVIITDSSYEYQTFKGNGGNPVQYAISVELANKTIRR